MDELEEINESENESEEEGESIADLDPDDVDIPDDKNIILNESDDDDDDEGEIEDEYLNKVKDPLSIEKKSDTESKQSDKSKHIYSVYNYKENENIIEDNLSKFDNELKKNYLLDFHPECISKNFEEIKILSKIVRDKNHLIIDEFHKTLPILTKFEKTKIIGIRTKQLNNGAKPYISVDEKIIDNYIIASMELNEKKLPFIISRPIPNNNFEYWKLQDLEIL